MLRIYKKEIVLLILCIVLAPCLSAFAEDTYSLQHENIKLRVTASIQDGQKNLIITVHEAQYETKLESFSLSNPHRIVVDIPGLIVSKGKEFPTTIPSISKIRIGQHPDKTRIVLDISAKELPSYRVQFTDSSSYETKVEATPQIEVPSSRAEQPITEYKAAEELSVPSPDITQKITEISFSVDSVHLDFRAADTPVKDITLSNRSKETLYFTATPYQLEKAGFEEESQTETHNLLVSPRRFSLEPDQERTVRVVLSMGHSEREHVYRLNFLAQLEPFSDSTITESFIKEREKSGLITGIAVLATVEPKQSNVALAWNRSEGLVELKNTGNVNLLLAEGKACKKNKACRDIPSRRLYPGNTWRIKADAKEAIEFLQKHSKDYESLSIPAEEEKS